MANFTKCALSVAKSISEGWQVGEVGRVHFFRGVSGW